MRGILWALLGAIIFSTTAFAQVVDLSALPPLFGQADRTVIAEGEVGAFHAVVTSDCAAVPADGESEAEIGVVLTDAAGKPVKGRMLALLLAEGSGSAMPDEPVTDAEGKAYFTYRAGRVAVTNRFELMDVQTGKSMAVTLPTSLTAEVTVELIDPLEFNRRVTAAMARPDIFDLEVIAQPEALPADEVSCSRLTGRLTYKDGRPAAGFPVKFSIASGFGQIEQEETVTDKDGYIGAFYRVSDRVGTVIVEARELTTGKVASVEITVVEAGPAKLKLWLEDTTGAMFEERAVMPADGATQMTVVVQVLSLVDTPIAGAKVQFKLASDLGRLEVVDGVSDGNGMVRALFTAGTFTGTERITAYLVSEPLS